MQMSTTPEFLALLEDSYATERKLADCPPRSRLEYLSEHIFDFTTYDSNMAEEFARHAVRVCQAVNDRATFQLVNASHESYMWYLVMCNTAFFAGRLEWGTSIRGAWWCEVQMLWSCGLWVDDEQCSELVMSAVGWNAFVRAMIEFVKEEL
jgi:hypothetical protein